MYERILLPLRGSQLSEVALYYAEELAGRLGSELILLHACSPQNLPFRHVDEIYLEHMANKLRSEVKKKFPRSEGAQVRTEVIIGEPAEVICDYVTKNDIDLVITAIRGASGLKIWIMGSVVDEVIQRVKIPVLLIRARENPPVEGKKCLINRILLPLDGSEASEIVVPYAVELAKGLKASISLFRMVEKTHYPTEALRVIDVTRVEAIEKEHVRTYLIDMERGLRQKGIPVTHAMTVGTDPATEILEQGEKTKADLVVMAGRGVSPIARWLFGNVAEKVLREGDLPLLVVR